MSLIRKKKLTRQRRAERVRHHIKKTASRPRISVHRSLKHIYAQLIDDTAGTTLAAASSHDVKDVTGDKKAVARAVGMALAKQAKEKGVNEIYFDRGPFLYHGRVKELADGLREGGLTI
ncbi:MAG: 50S ribosomal protein L18 [Candidatus Babeliales bacterium]